MNIQSIVEKYLEEACIDNACTDGASIIIMNPQNGDILAMANYPDYDLNNPYTISDSNLLETWDSLEQSEKSTYLQAMWRNKAISDTYEPGSCFKLVTASSALEEGIVSGPDNSGEFCCTGGIEIAGVRIKCWRYYRPHGAESLREALMNSCNPVFIGLGQKIGISKYYEYLEKFGFLRKTGIDIYGEAGSIFLKEDKVGPVELATISFGQRFEVTPIQMITMVSTIANKGVYVYPRLVKATIDSQTGIQTDIEPKFGDRVISESTAETVLSMMNSVVSEGTGKNAKVEGYSIGGKTGTSEDGVNTGKYVTSFIGVAPTEDPQVAILITLYNPTGEGGHQGGGVAAPIAGQILGEVLPYLEIQKTQEEEETLIQVPNVVGLDLKEAKEVLDGFNIQLISSGENSEESIVYKQIPESGIEIDSSGEVILYVE
jgi:stage V sporulation protein D (sporulation-specific penicillin-binding protein)